MIDITYYHDLETLKDHEVDVASAGDGTYILELGGEAKRINVWALLKLLDICERLFPTAHEVGRFRELKAL